MDPWLGIAVGAAAIALVAWAALRRRVGDLTEQLERSVGTRSLDRLSEAPGPVGRLAIACNHLISELLDLRVKAIDQRRELHWMRQRQLLSDLAETYTSTLDIDEVLETVCVRVAQALDVDEVAVMLLDADELWVAAAHGVPESEDVVGLRFEPDEGLTGVVWKAVESLVYVPDVGTDPRFLHWKGRHPIEAGSTVGIRLEFGGEKLGMLVLTRLHADGFAEVELQALGIVAHQAAIAVRNARMYERTLELATHDELTGLLNRRQFVQRLEAEWFRRLRFGDPVAVLMMDVDHFKRFNDNYGHLVGDAVLMRIAHAIEGNLRQIDVAARYGGEEFVVLLSRQSRKGALRVAEKLRAAVEAADIQGVLEGADQRATVSVGVAVVIPGQEKDMEPMDLVARADAALLRAKEEGRNRVVFSEDDP